MNSLLRNTFFVILLGLNLLLLGCSTSEEEEAPVEEVIIEDVVPEFYASLDKNSTLEDFWEIFRQDAIRSGKLDPGLNREVILFYGTEPDFASGITSDHAGRAYDICNDNNVRFEVIKSYWEDYSVISRLITFYHEAGHARYKYRHPCENGESCSFSYDQFPIMWRSIGRGDYTWDSFVEDKNLFFSRNWDGIRYFNCGTN